MRIIFILLIVTVALALARLLVKDVVRAVTKALGSNDSEAARSGEASSGGKVGHFVRDPESGAYIDEQTALRAEIDGETHFFESVKTRDAYLHRKSSA